MGKPTSPGPVYMLPPTIGYNKHDYSRYRNPQWTMRPKVYPPGPSYRVPGPQYAVRGLTEYGPVKTPAYSLSSRPKPLTAFSVPGPGTYSPEKVANMKGPIPPAYTMQKRLAAAYKSIGPGPLAYSLPSMLGPKVPNKQANGAYTITGRPRGRMLAESPGPASYKGINTNLYKRKQPQYTLAARLAPLRPATVTPGPAAYIPKKMCGDGGPKFSLRPRANDIIEPYITPDDAMPCAD